MFQSFFLVQLFSIYKYNDYCTRITWNFPTASHSFGSAHQFPVNHSSHLPQLNWKKVSGEKVFLTLVYTDLTLWNDKPRADFIHLIAFYIILIKRQHKVLKRMLGKINVQLIRQSKASRSSDHRCPAKRYELSHCLYVMSASNGLVTLRTIWAVGEQKLRRITGTQRANEETHAR